MSNVVGIVANPMAGKDIRRLVSAASPVSDMAKIGLIRRAMIGAFEGGATKLLYSDDRNALAARAAEGIDLPAGCSIEALDLAILSSSADSSRAAAAMADRGAGALVVLGGDGTHRDVAKGWRDAPLVTLSTGTNNVFPRAVESTLAGEAAGAVASAHVELRKCARQACVLDVEVDDGRRDLALVDIARADGAFTGSRAVWNVDSLRELIAVIAEPASVGLSAIAAAVAPSDRTVEEAVYVRFDANAPHQVRCPIAPGRYETLGVAHHHRMRAGESVDIAGPGVVSFDGERDLVLDDHSARVTLRTDGPWVIDVAHALELRRVAAR